MADSIIPFIVAAILGIVGIVLLARKSGKDAKKVMNIFGIFLLIVGVFAVAWQVGWLTSLGINPIGQVTIPGTQIVLSAVPTGQQTPQISTGCGIEDTTVTLSATDKFTSLAAGTNHRYRVNGGPALTVANAGTFTASPFDTLSILWGNETDATYFGDVSTETIPCKGTITLSKQLYSNGSATINVYTEGGDLIDGSAYNETLGAGDVANLKIEVRASNERGFPHGGVLSLEVNKSDYDEEKIALSLSGLTLTPTAAPTIDTLGNVGNTIVAWIVSPFEGTELHTGTLTLDVDNTNNPSNVNDPVITFYPYDYFVNEDAGGAYSGPAVEDEDRVQTFGHATSATISVA